MRDLPNIVIFVFDTMRLDALGNFYNSLKAPTLSSFSQKALRFENAIAPSSWTIPSHASMLLGKYPIEHGLHESKGTYVTDVVGKTLPKNRNVVEYLRKVGYNTIGISSNIAISPQNGFDYGFNLFNNHDSGSIRLNPFENKENQTNGLEVSKMIELYGRYRKLKTNGYPLKKGGNEIMDFITKSTLESPFFLFINVTEMHEPYTKGLNNAKEQFFGINQISDYIGKKKYSNSTMTKMKSIYFNDEVAESDNIFATFLRFLKESNQIDNTLTIITSDHGQSFKENGFFGHGNFVSDEMVRIPLIIRPPKSTELVSTKINNGYQSLAFLRDFLINTLEGESNYNLLSRETVFSETFSSTSPIPNDLVRSDHIMKAKELEAGYKAVFKDGYKLTVNMTTNNVVEFIKQGSSTRPINRKILKDLSEELEIFAGVSGLTQDIMKNSSES